MTELDKWRGEQFAILCEFEPRLREFEEECFQFALTHKNEDCMAAWHGWGRWRGIGFKTLLLPLVGSGSDIDAICDSDSWDIAYHHCLGILERASSPDPLTASGWCP